MLYSKRKKFDAYGRKIGEIFSRLGISPNLWTAAAIIFALLSFFFLVRGSFIFGAILFALSSFFDVIDGAVAREMKKSTRLGAYMDTIADRYAEFIVMAALVFVGMPQFIIPSVFWLFLYLFGSNMTTYAKAAAKEKGIAKKEISGGILERGDRLILLFIGLIAAEFSRIYLLYIIIILAILSNITALQRIKIAVKSK